MPVPSSVTKHEEALRPACVGNARSGVGVLVPLRNPFLKHILAQPHIQKDPSFEGLLGYTEGALTMAHVGLALAGTPGLPPVQICHLLWEALSRPVCPRPHLNEPELSLFVIAL